MTNEGNTFTIRYALLADRIAYYKDNPKVYEVPKLMRQHQHSIVNKASV